MKKKGGKVKQNLGKKRQRQDSTMDALELFMEGYAREMEKIELNSTWTTDDLEKIATLIQLLHTTLKTMGKAAPEIVVYAVAGDVISEMLDLMEDEYPAIIEMMGPILEKLSKRLTEKYG